MLVDEAQGSWSADEVCSSATDILAVDWLDENVVVAGGRDGGVRLWDARSRGQSTRLQFPSTISHVKAVGSSRVIVAGLKNNVSRLLFQVLPTSIWLQSFAMIVAREKCLKKGASLTRIQHLICFLQRCGSTDHA